ncbi:hypothetical protein GLOIN_2v971975 [Rhizophagus irregularis DAOM 181602=DAOM 197198]|uniref:Uncharacterized protein n=1 Tax=Rhizophagus irregularis (strain DAOM 181602 / DAOM 197198 / MUCL 43194) TaxID=747089 RepID=A0A2P4QCS0_RHIID|nr:hypothetical protein GLOIN_2v971975 [Rhizophagus irregularis DAOM 181602=DAOM 197198]POG75438.1 hypothetical protein GLOIN_2v971975 [Rhizophagus irregularis DAOM 181602=DAOM 197198]|eukprot:XP_025182304.1 hypothetical protein GLOIN_2v971975 [Rhizophagus irregularis DAOM 181602=DAOM 197198]
MTQTQATPKLQTPAVSTVVTPNTNSIPPQVIQITPNVLAQTPQPIKITSQSAPNNVQMQSPAPAGTMSRPPQRPTFTSQQPMPGSQMFARPQNMPGVKFPQLHAQLHAQLASMTPEKRAQYIANLTAQQPLRNNPQLRNALTINNAQISNQLLRQQNTLLQHELVASQQNLANVLGRNPQLNLGLPLQNGINIGQQHFVTSAAPISEAVSTQALNGFVSSAALNAATAQQLGAFNASTTPTSNSVSAVGYTTASTSVGTINTQFGGNTTATNSAQLPASTMNSISTAGMTGQTANVTTGVIGQMANGGIRPNMPQKKINALWSGHIAWSANNNQGQKRELTCQVSAFPVPTKKTAPLSQIDYMISCWPEKMEISGINHAKDVISNASANPKIVSFLPNPTNPTIQENNNTFGVLMRILEGRKMVGCFCTLS